MKIAIIVRPRTEILSVKPWENLFYDPLRIVLTVPFTDGRLTMPAYGVFLGDALFQ